MGGYLYSQGMGCGKKYLSSDIVLLVGPGENSLAQL